MPARELVGSRTGCFLLCMVLVGCGEAASNTYARGSGGSAAGGGSTGAGGNAGGNASAPGGGSGGTSVGMDAAAATGGTVDSGAAVGMDGGSERFLVGADGLAVLDMSTGLVWQRDGVGPREGCTGNAAGTRGDGGTGNLTCTWTEAKTYCTGLNLNGTGWRLPTLAEVETLLDFTVTAPPMINQKALPNTPTGFFWTSSQYDASPGSAWLVNFISGGPGYTVADDTLRVRCVR